MSAANVDIAAFRQRAEDARDSAKINSTMPGVSGLAYWQELYATDVGVLLDTIEKMRAVRARHAAAAGEAPAETEHVTLVCADGMSMNREVPAGLQIVHVAYILPNKLQNPESLHAFYHRKFERLLTVRGDRTTVFCEVE